VLLDLSKVGGVLEGGVVVVELLEIFKSRHIEGTILRSASVQRSAHEREMDTREGEKRTFIHRLISG
jgi:hypothetical protein